MIVLVAPISGLSLFGFPCLAESKPLEFLAPLSHESTTAAFLKRAKQYGLEHYEKNIEFQPKYMSSESLQQTIDRGNWLLAIVPISTLSALLPADQNPATVFAMPLGYGQVSDLLGLQNGNVGQTILDQLERFGYFGIAYFNRSLRRQVILFDKTLDLSSLKKKKNCGVSGI